MLASLAGAAAGKIAGGFIDDYFNKQAAERSYENNKKLQDDDQAFQKEMRATQYQTTVDDMQKAGINPAVALSGGASLSSQGGGSSASASAPSGTKTNIAETMMSLKERKTGLKQIENNINNQTALTNADVELKNAQAIKTMKEAGYTQHQIDYYLANGVFPGATITTSKGYKGPLGIGGNVATTRPVGLHKTNENTPSQWEKEQLSKMPKEKWKNLSKAQRMMFPSELRTLYNHHYN